MLMRDQHLYKSFAKEIELCLWSLQITITKSALFIAGMVWDRARNLSHGSQ